MTKKWTAADIPPQVGRVAIVTGANRGLGLEVAQALARAGAHVIVAARDPTKIHRAVAEIVRNIPGANAEAMVLDQADLSAIRSFAREFRARLDRLDLLINNASAIMAPQSKTANKFEMHIGVNHLGSFALTGLLIDRLIATPGARIVNTGSSAHRLVKGLDLDDLNFERPPYREMEAYGRSKLATLLFTAELDRRMRRAATDVKAVAAHPGYSNTNPDKGGGLARRANALLAQPVWMGALPQLYAATAHGVDGGDYIGPGGLAEMRGYPAKAVRSATARDVAAAERLWRLSEELTGVRFLDQRSTLPERTQKVYGVA